MTDFLLVLIFCAISLIVVNLERIRSGLEDYTNPHRFEHDDRKGSIQRYKDEARQWENAWQYQPWSYLEHAVFRIISISIVVYLVLLGGQFLIEFIFY